MTALSASPVWSPSPERVAGANLTHYLAWLRERGVDHGSYEELRRWSVEDLEGFWASVWDYSRVLSDPYERVLARRAMPGAEWFPGARLNYAEHALRWDADSPALLFDNEAGARAELTFGELRARVAAAAAWMRERGVGPGDRVVGFLPSIPETFVAFLACSSLGATWAMCSPEFGAASVVDRLGQIAPKLLFAVDGYRFNGRAFDRRDVVAELMRRLPTLERVVLVPYLDPGARLAGTTPWSELEADAAGEPEFLRVPFDHPLWILYSSGTTGLPKAIVHGHGGILLEHLKSHAFHLDLRPGDRYQWYGGTGWAVWNQGLSALLVGATVVAYDGSPSFPDLGALWRLAAEREVTYFGAGAPLLQACMRAGIAPGEAYDLSRVTRIGSTGAPLSPEAFRWVYERVAGDVLLSPMSGGTDVCSSFVGPCPILPVHVGEMQCRWLGAAVDVLDEDGRSVTGEVGELVITEPMPSMPVRLWGDEDGVRYRSSYLEAHPGVWTHGDWIEIKDNGGAVVYGRSDSTLNRGGVRMGTSEFYRVVDAMDELADSLIVDTSHGDADGKLVLFVVPAPGVEFGPALRDQLVRRLRTELSPRHVPDEIHAVADIPRTINGKRLEVPVKRLLRGEPPERLFSPGTMANPEALDAIVAIAAARGRPPEGPLADIRVLDLTVALAGPFATLQLAGLGADVIKIERPGGGDAARWNPPFVGSKGMHFGLSEGDDMSVSMMNRARNKKSVTLDLKQPRGRELFLELCRTADVVVENFSEGTAERLGVGHSAVAAVNPRVVYCSISGRGQQSPDPDMKVMDIIVQAMSGIMAATGFADGPPVRVGIPIGDLVAPLYAFGGIMAALWQRQRTGRGQYIDVSMLDSVATLVAEEHFEVFTPPALPVRSGNFHTRLTPFGVYRTSDGYVAIGASMNVWAHAVFEAIGRPEMATDERYSDRGGRTVNSLYVNGLIEEWTSQRTTEEVIDELYAKRRVPTVKVREPREVIEDEHLRARGAVVPLRHPTVKDTPPIAGSGLPMRFSDAAVSFNRPAPVLGEHNEVVYRDSLGLTEEEVEELRREGVI